jgi:hypothetical protein
MAAVKQKELDAYLAMLEDRLGGKTQLYFDTQVLLSRLLQSPVGSSDVVPAASHERTVDFWFVIIFVCLLILGFLLGLNWGLWLC